jgi:large subunit ribosomal protein L28
MAKCDMCEKHKTFGHNVSFSKNRTNREFKPNIHRHTLTIDGTQVSVKLCTRCLRTLSKTR